MLAVDACANDAVNAVVTPHDDRPCRSVRRDNGIQLLARGGAQCAPIGGPRRVYVSCPHQMLSVDIQVAVPAVLPGDDCPSGAIRYEHRELLCAGGHAHGLSIRRPPCNSIGWWEGDQECDRK